MKDVQCYDLFGGIARKNHAFSFSFSFHFIFYFLEFHLAVKIDLAKVVFYLKHVFHLLYDLSATPARHYFTFPQYHKSLYNTKI